MHTEEIGVTNHKYGTYGNVPTIANFKVHIHGPTLKKSLLALIYLFTKQIATV